MTGNLRTLGAGLSSSIVIDAHLGPDIQQQVSLMTLWLMEYRVRHIFNLIQNTRSWWTIECSAGYRDEEPLDISWVLH